MCMHEGIGVNNKATSGIKEIMDYGYVQIHHENSVASSACNVPSILLESVNDAKARVLKVTVFFFFFFFFTQGEFQPVQVIIFHPGMTGCNSS